MIAQDYLARGESVTQCLCIIIRVAVALRGDDFAEKIPGAETFLRRTYARGVQPIKNGLNPFLWCISVFDMDINSLADQVLAFFNDGIGAVIWDVFRTLLEIFSPSNSDPATVNR